MKHIREATHIEPHTKAYYKKEGDQWYVWSRIAYDEPYKWVKSTGTNEFCLFKNRFYNRTVDDAMKSAEELRTLLSKNELDSLSESSYDMILLLEEIYRIQKRQHG